MCFFQAHLSWIGRLRFFSFIGPDILGYVIFVLRKAYARGHWFMQIVIQVLWRVDFEGKYKNGSLQLLAKKVDVAIKFHHNLFGNIKPKPHLISIKQVDVVGLLLRQEVWRTLGLENLIDWLLVLFLDANSSVHHYEYYLGGHFVEIDEHGHLAVIIGVDHLVFYDIDGHLLEPLGVPEHESW